MVAMKILAIAAVGGTAWLFMRPRFSPILPPNPPGPWTDNSADDDPPLIPLGPGLHLGLEGCLKGQLVDSEGRPASARPDSSDQSNAELLDVLGTVTENELIVHALLLQGDKLAAAADDPSQPGSSFAAAAQQVQDVAEQAFWDVLYDGLISTPQQWDRLVALIVDARNQLADIIPKRTPEGQGLLADMLDKLDEGYMRTRLEVGFDPSYLRQLLDYLVYIIGSLEAPARRESTKQAYEQLGRDFDAAVNQKDSRDPSNLIRLSVEVRRSMEVPVRVRVRDAWHPVEVASEKDLLSPPATPKPGSQSVSRAPSPSDWVTSFSPSPSPRPNTPPDFSFPSPSHSQTYSQRLARRDPWVGVEAPTEPTVGSPMEEEVEVKFGMLVEKDEVFVQLQAADHSPHSQSRSSSPHRSSDSARSPKEQAIARVVVKAARFVLEKLRQLRSDAARAHLELLKGLLQGSSSGIEYERRRYTVAIGDRSVKDALPRAFDWLQAALSKVQASRGSDRLSRALVQGVLTLVQHPSALTPTDCPETLLLDCSQLVGLQNELQRLSLAAAALLVAQQLLTAKGQPCSYMSPNNTHFFAAVKSRFLSLLAAPGVQLPQLMQAMGMLLSQRLGLVELSPEDEDMVSRLLSRVFAVDDPIYQKVQTGIIAGLALLLDQMCSKGAGRECNEASTEACRGKLRHVGADLLLEEVITMAQFVAAIITLNEAVCEPFYCIIMAEP